MPTERSERPATRTYDFSRLLPAMAGGLLAAAGLAVVCWAACSARAAPLSPRLVYGWILAAAGLLSAGLALSGWKGAAKVLLAAAWLDLIFGMGTHLIALTGARNSFLPMATVSLRDTKRFVYHPLLQGVPAPGFDNGFFIHDGKGRRAVLPKGAEKGPRIAVVGGSSTYDLGVPNGRTWPEELQRLLPETRIFNYGVPGYATVEHIIQTAFYLAPERISCAVYYVGWNDIRNSFLPTLDPAYADYHLLGHVDFMRIRSVTGLSSIWNFLANARLVRRLTSFIPTPADYRAARPRSGTDARLEAIYRRNLETIAAINRAQGRKTVFIPQVLNYAALKGKGRYGWFPLVRDRDVPAINDHFNAVLKEEAARLGAPVAEISPADFAPEDFVDYGHFSERGARKFARLLAPFIRNACGIR